MRVKVEPPAPAIEVGENDAVTPDGIPLAVRFTTSENPNKDPIDMAEVVELPDETESDAGDAEMVKSGGAFTVRFTATVCTETPLVP